MTQRHRRTSNFTEINTKFSGEKTPFQRTPSHPANNLLHVAHNNRALYPRLPYHLTASPVSPGRTENPDNSSSTDFLSLVQLCSERYCPRNENIPRRRTRTRDGMFRGSTGRRFTRGSRRMKLGKNSSGGRTNLSTRVSAENKMGIDERASGPRGRKSHRVRASNDNV